MYVYVSKCSTAADALTDELIIHSQHEQLAHRLFVCLFQMFCRLFVDENLDRLIPISKQPKEKLQSILDACNRQFPEFQERSRKRVRTYLKSCRRMRRARNMNGIEGVSITSLSICQGYHTRGISLFFLAKRR